jgi:DNA mismatch endonuclease (patch repair protein)
MKLYSLCTHRSLKGNRANAQKVMQALLAKGWRIGTIWECALRGKKMTIEAIVNSMEEWLKSDRLFLEIRG